MLRNQAEVVEYEERLDPQSQLHMDTFAPIVKALALLQGPVPKITVLVYICMTARHTYIHTYIYTFTYTYIYIHRYV